MPRPSLALAAATMLALTPAAKSTAYAAIPPATHEYEPVEGPGCREVPYLGAEAEAQNLLTIMKELEEGVARHQPELWAERERHYHDAIKLLGQYGVQVPAALPLIHATMVPSRMEEIRQDVVADLRALMPQLLHTNTGEALLVVAFLQNRMAFLINTDPKHFFANEHHEQQVDDFERASKSLQRLTADYCPNLKRADEHSRAD